MAVYRAKIQELLRLIPDLQCYKCKNVPGTVINLTIKYFTSFIQRDFEKTFFFHPNVLTKFSNRWAVETQSETSESIYAWAKPSSSGILKDLRRFDSK